MATVRTYLTTNDVMLYVRCPMAYLIKNEYGIERSIYTQEEMYDILLEKAAIRLLAYYMDGSSYNKASAWWSEADKTLPDKVRSARLFLDGVNMLQNLWKSGEVWSYVAVAHPYEWTYGSSDILQGVVPAIRASRHKNRQDRVLQLVSIGRPQSPLKAQTDVKSTLSRLALVSSLRRELRASCGHLQTVQLCIPDGKVVEIKDDRKRRYKARAYLRAIVRGIRVRSYYPRYERCKNCGYRPACDPKLAHKIISDREIRRVKELLRSEPKL